MVGKAQKIRKSTVFPHGWKLAVGNSRTSELYRTSSRLDAAGSTVDLFAYSSGSCARVPESVPDLSPLCMLWIHTRLFDSHFVLVPAQRSLPIGREPSISGEFRARPIACKSSVTGLSVAFPQATKAVALDAVLGICKTRVWRSKQ